MEGEGIGPVASSVYIFGSLSNWIFENLILEKVIFLPAFINLSLHININLSLFDDRNFVSIST